MSTKQTRMTADEKADVREQLVEFGNAGGFVIAFPKKGLTMALRPLFPGSRFAMMGLAWCAADEEKFRKLVGAQLAMSRTDWEGVAAEVPVMREDYEEFAVRFAEMFTDQV